MDLEWFSDFLVLANTRNFSSAADARHITQSAFSRRIQGLEYWVGVPLIDRSTYPVRLTSAGEMFRTSADEIVRTLNYTRDECRAEVRSDPDAISFVALHTLAVNYFPAWFRRIEDVLGVQQTRMQAHNLHDGIQLLVTGNCSFFLCYAHHKTPVLLDAERYPSLKMSDETIIPVSATDKSGQPRFMISESSSVPLPYLSYAPNSFLCKMVELILAHLEKPLVLQSHYENTMAEALKMMVLEGYGIAWLPESCVKQELASGDLVALGSDPHRIKMEVRIYRSATPAKPAAERLWKLLQETCEG